MKLENTDEKYEERDGGIGKGDEESEVFSLLPRKQTPHVLHDLIVDLIVIHTHQLGDANGLR